MKDRVALIMAAAALAFGVCEARAYACATCAVGDPTLTVMGAEQPFAGRLRLSASFEHRSESSGLEAMKVQEQRFVLGVSHSPLQWLQLSVSAPLVRRAVVSPDLASDTLYNLGDVELRARFVVFRDRKIAASHLLSVSAGIELPTTPNLARPDGNAPPLEARAGTASFDPLFQVAYAHFGDPWSLYVSTTLLLPTRGRFDLQAGRALFGALVGQYQLNDTVALRLGVDARLDASARIAGEVDPDTGGAIAFVSPELALSPVDDLVLRAYVRWPVIARLSGEHSEGPMFGFGAAHDL